MTNYSTVEQSVAQLSCDLSDLISELDAISRIFESGWKINGTGEFDLVCGEMAKVGYAEVCKRLSRLAKYNSGVVFYEMGDEK